MPNITLSSMISAARSKADMPVAGFVTDAEVTNWLNEGLKQLHKLLVDAFGEEYAFKEQAMSFVTGTTDYALPTDFFRLYGIDITFAGRTRALMPFNQAERNAYRNRSGAGVYWFAIGAGPAPRYLLIKNQSGVGSMLRLYPMLITAPGTVLYAPGVTTLASPSDTVELPDGWEKYAITYAAIQMLNKEESSSAELQKQMARWDSDLIDAKETRDAAFPKKVVDMDRVKFDDVDYP